MNTMEKSDALRNEENNQAVSENKYHAFDYFKEHTGLLIAVVSAVVAITSFALDYAIALQNISYMKYWNISTAYIPNETGVQLYLVFSAFVHSIVAVFIHALMSKTAGAYRYYYEIILHQRANANGFKARLEKLKEEQVVIGGRLQKIDDCEEKREIQRELEFVLNEIPKLEKLNFKVNLANKKVMRKIIARAIRSSVVSFLLSLLSVSVLCVAFSVQLKLGVLLLISGVQLFLDVMVYFGPILAMKKPKTVTDEDLIRIANELTERETPEFPLENLLYKDGKAIVSDRNIVRMLLQYIGAFAIGLLMFFQLGSIDAKQEKKLSYLH